jgi:nucleoside 2-deoxyribosyltransferase
MPFSDDYKDSYEYGVKLVLDQKGLDHYKANNEIQNKDTMCKICKEIQSCGKVIANISGLNPNVMLELGLAYGLGKEVIIIKDKKTTTISDLGGIEYIEYAHAVELQQKLSSIL